MKKKIIISLISLIGIICIIFIVDLVNIKLNDKPIIILKTKEVVIKYIMGYSMIHIIAY